MNGVLYFSNLYYDWITQLQAGWSFLNTPILVALDNLISSNALVKLFAGSVNLLKGFVVATGFSGLTVLEFMFVMSGVGFGVYALVTIVTWALNVIT